jgi:hypothetical protein
MREKATDALLGAMIKSTEELEALVAMLEYLNSSDGPKLSSKLRESADLLDRLPLLANDLRTIKRRLRGMLSSDPDKTPRAVSIRELQAVIPEGEKRFEPVEEDYRKQTRPGIGVPLPKKT